MKWLNLKIKANEMIKNEFKNKIKWTCGPISSKHIWIDNTNISISLIF